MPLDLSALFELSPDDIDLLMRAVVSMPLAAVLGSALAFRPQRRGTPMRETEVIHAQIILAVVGALVMIVIGESLARAFGIVGIAGLIRYRTKIGNAKDAGVMLSNLAIGLSAGSGLYAIAAFATIFVLLLLGVVESHEPRAYLSYQLKLSTSDPAILRPRVEATLRRLRIRYELRSFAEDELRYAVRLPLERKSSDLSAEMARLADNEPPAFEWELKEQ